MDTSGTLRYARYPNKNKNVSLFSTFSVCFPTEEKHCPFVTDQVLFDYILVVKWCQMSFVYGLKNDAIQY